MKSKATDVRRTVIYGSEKMTLQLLAMAVGVFALGVVGIYTSYGMKQTLAWGIALVGLGWVLYELYRTLFPRQSLMELSPRGLLIRVHPNDMLIPWHEIRGVDTVDIKGRRGRLNIEVTIPKVTVVLVSRRFFDEAIGEGFFVNGGAWGESFLPKGDSVQIALQPDLLPVKSPEIRREVEARWRAFGDPRRTGRAQGDVEDTPPAPPAAGNSPVPS